MEFANKLREKEVFFCAASACMCQVINAKWFHLEPVEKNGFIIKL
jgi:hypothetical protein